MGDFKKMLERSKCKISTTFNFKKGPFKRH